ncbi:hypothetical protein NDU88_005794 [Pleurodeles waltl]|uniref:Uncharacterized protein n=1 Tax=Pleurodeles waltl TaxID=8319 RepID=A0AAV7VPE1_PLEWA|nr:hypothetical protein NDU88_005794 [Pleurodeles waltl]
MTSGMQIGNPEEAVEKRPASESGEVESGKEESGEEESGKEECGEKESAKEKSDGIGERFLPSRGKKTKRWQTEV